MADYVAAHITVGGAVSERLLPKFCDTICRQGVGLDWGEFDFCPDGAEDLLEACQEIAGAKVLRLYSDEVPYGNFDLLQEFLSLHELPFDRWHDAKYEICCEKLSYRPGQAPRCDPTNAQEEVVVTADPLLSLPDLLDNVQRLVERGDERDARRVLRQCQTLLSEHLPPAIAPLPPFQIRRGRR